MTGELENRLRAGLSTLGLAPDVQPCDAYLAYIDLLGRWNRAYSLTAIHGADRLLSWHVLDALSLLPHVQGRLCLDVGTGAGLPGLILALANPGQRWVLLDSNHKKIRFVNQAILELGIRNAEAVCVRLEDYHTEPLFTSITARAFSSLSGCYEQTRHLLAQDGSLLVQKGPDVGAEVAELDEHGMNVQVHTVTIPGVEGTRSLVVIRPPG